MDMLQCCIVYQVIYVTVVIQHQINGHVHFDLRIAFHHEVLGTHLCVDDVTSDYLHAWLFHEVL